jgi:uncharacterized iron-regulated membrane protein
VTGPLVSRRGLLRLHRWMGLNIGLLLFIVCFSGTCATLGHEWDELLGAPPGSRSCAEIDWAAVEGGAKSLPGIVSHLMVRDPCRPVSALNHPDGTEIQRVALDRTTGEVLDRGSPLTIQEFLRQFHKALLLPGGLYLVTLTSLVLGYSIVSGLLVYRRWWSHWRRLRWRLGPRVLWSDMHRAFGVWTSIFGAIMVVTGLWYLVEAGARDTTGFVAEPPIPRMDRDRLRDLPPQPERLPLAQVVSAAEQAIPGLDVRAVHFPVRLGDAVQVDGQTDALLVRDRANRVYLDPYDGRVLGRKFVGELTPLERWADTADELHFGTFGGLPVKLLWFVLGLLLSAVCLAGPVMWYLRRKRIDTGGDRRPRARARGFLPYAPVLALLVVSSCAVAQGLRSPALGAGAPVTRQSAPTRVGPWSVVASYRSSAGAERGRYQIAAAGRGDPTWTAATIELPGDARPRPMRVSHRGVVLSAPAAETVTLRLTAASGSAHQGRLALVPVAAAEPGRVSAIPRYVSAFVLAFMLLQLVGAAAWAAVIRRRFSGRPARADSPGRARADDNPLSQRNTP